MQLSNFDFIYSGLAILLGIIMIASPRTLMRGANYDEESLKTESLVKKLGVAVIVLGIILGVYLFLR